MFWTYYFGRVVSLEIFYALILFFFFVQTPLEKIDGELFYFINNDNTNKIK